MSRARPCNWGQTAQLSVLVEALARRWLSSGIGRGSTPRRRQVAENRRAFVGAADRGVPPKLAQGNALPYYNGDTNGRENMATHRVETRLNETTIRELDGWRSGRTPSPSRSEAVRLLLEERLCGRRPDPRAARPTPDRCPATGTLAAIYVLERVSGFGPVKFREMHDAGVDPQVAIENPDRLPFRGRTGDKLRSAIRALSRAEVTAGHGRATEQLERASDCGASILVHGDPGYPSRVYESNNPVPVLYVRGDPNVWKGTSAVAVVGSRRTRDPYASCALNFAATAARRGVIIVSGFAIGTDTIGHRAAHKVGGRTVCVMPCGLDRVFPPENRSLWEELLAYPEAVFVSEFGFGQRASSLLLRKRNKLIVAFAQGILVAQSATDGGAMNAYRFGRDQKKPVATFRADGSTYTTGNSVITDNTGARDVTFEVTADGSAYEAWLDGLSSWI